MIVSGKGKERSAEAIFLMLAKFKKARLVKKALPLDFSKEIFIKTVDVNKPKQASEALYLMRKSSLSILVLTRFNILPDENPQNREEVEVLKSLIAKLPKSAYVIYNADDPDLKKIISESQLSNIINFGFHPAADFRASDVNTNHVINFKANYKGSIVPVWLEGVAEEGKIYSALSAMAVGKIFDLNLIHATQAIKNCHLGSGL